MHSEFTAIPSLLVPLREQITGIKNILNTFHQDLFVGAILFGSCSRGNATYRSDIDIMLIFEQNNLDFKFVQTTRDSVENHFFKHGSSTLLKTPLPVEFQVVRTSVFSSTEEEMKKNLRTGIILTDKNNILRKNMELFNEQS